ncbi:MAG TPA: hypothetical protein VHR86_04155, partial [Armatimonadota bacterium]|nr:hypothetical protein [Armatimonadota bacterium]
MYFAAHYMNLIARICALGAVALLAGCQSAQHVSKQAEPIKGAPAPAPEIKVTIERLGGGSTTADFNFKNLPKPARNDAATTAQFTLVDGRQDPNGENIDKLHDGQIPRQEDQPQRNFFFAQGTDGGRILVDLGKATSLKQVNSYSCHPGSRGPQVYNLFASDGQAGNFNPQPKKDTDPEKCGWKLIAKVDTHTSPGEPGGTHGASISSSSGAIGNYRYLLFDIYQTENSDSFGNTFYSEIDVIEQNGPA